MISVDASGPGTITTRTIVPYSFVFGACVVSLRELDDLINAMPSNASPSLRKTVEGLSLDKLYKRSAIPNQHIAKRLDESTYTLMIQV